MFKNKQKCSICEKNNEKQKCSIGKKALASCADYAKKCPGVNREWYTDIIKEANEAVRKKVKDLIRDMKNLIKQHKSIPGEKGFRITNCYNCYNPSLV